MPVCDVDQLADQLAYLGQLGRNMPPAWDGAKVRHVVKSPLDGSMAGYLLPGRGYQIGMDLKQLGITKVIPHVYEETILNKVYDALLRPAKHFNEETGQIIDPERGAIATYDGIIAKRAGGFMNDVWISKATLTTTALVWACLARSTGTPGAMTFNATTAPTQTACDRATAGAWSTGLSNPTSTNKKYLLTLGWTAVQQLNVGILVDVHVQSGSHRLTVTTAETVAAPVTVTRNYYGTLGAGNYLVFVTVTAPSATATNVTVSYTNQAGTAGQTTVLAGNTTATVADSLYPQSATSTTPMPFAPLATGDFGVRAFASTTSSVALVAGALAGLIVTPLTVLPGIGATAYVERDSTVQIDGLTELANVTQTIGCLNMIVLPNTTSTGVFGAFMRTTEG